MINLSIYEIIILFLKTLFNYKRNLMLSILKNLISYLKETITLKIKIQKNKIKKKLNYFLQFLKRPELKYIISYL